MSQLGAGHPDAGSDAHASTTEATIGEALCADTHGGADCGGDYVNNGVPATLYECAIARQPIAAMP